MCTTLQQRVLTLEETKTTQANEIASLKRRVKKLKKKQRSRTHKLKRLYKRRRIAKIDDDEDITLVDDAEKEMFDMADLDGEEVFVKEPKDVVDEVEITLTETLIERKSTRPKAKGVVIQEPSIMIEPERPLKRTDQIRADKEEARRLQAQFDEEAKLNKSFEDIQKLFKKAMTRVNMFVDMDTKVVEGSKTRIESSTKRTGEDLERESSKKQKVSSEQEAVEEEINDEQEKARLNECMQVVPFASWKNLHAGREEIPLKVVEKAKHGLKRIMMNSKGFFFFKFDSRAGLEVVLEGGPWLIIFEEDGISLIATFIGKHVMLDSYTSSMCNDSWGRSSFARCLIEVNSEADLVDVVTIGIPSLSEDDFTKETIRVEYEWRLPRCDTCKIFGHVHDYCPKKVVSPPIVATSNVVTPNAEKTNDGFQTVGKKKKRKGKSKSTNGGQFTGPSVKHNVRYEPKATTSAPKKGTTYVEEDDDEEDVENVYDESANLIQNTKAGGSSSFTAAAG
ncbi:zinc knuckle CX2CX4HX4C containing protein [Tanacetum coccineum]